jgi:glycosyltransferase involved in cell wall biosynthesis
MDPFAHPLEMSGELERVMVSSEAHAAFEKQMTVLENFTPEDWADIAVLLDKLWNTKKAPLAPNCEALLQSFARGTAFITFSFGIDGVSIEISKYAHALDDLYSQSGSSSLHLISGNFEAKVESILNPSWQRFHVEGINGWDKWDGGKWFEGLYKRRMRSHSEASNLLAREIFRQAVSIARRLGAYFQQHEIALAVPVNIASNPGNMALTLGLVLATEILGIYVLNNNHDFYWESGKPSSERDPEEPPGVRDHFFRNRRNTTFFSLFQDLHPWDGRRWLQVNINARQSRKLIDRYGFPAEKVFKISTYIADAFFEPYGRSDVIYSRLRMAHILSDGEAILRPVAIEDHLSGVGSWMDDQQPIIVGARSGLAVDPQSDDLLLLLQPTRIVRRKRIERNLMLIDALLRKSALRKAFDDNPKRQMILHITGPTPMEHQGDLERVLLAYRKTVRGLTENLADRIFLAFSVGNEWHASFADRQFQPLTIDAIYRMADVVVFPSEAEGRGLPIIESSACGIPIICSRYHHREVFSDVIGEHLPEADQIRYTRFPEGRFSNEFLSNVAALLIHPEEHQDRIEHNRQAVRARFGRQTFEKNFQQLLEQFCNLE